MRFRDPVQHVHPHATQIAQAQIQRQQLQEIVFDHDADEECPTFISPHLAHLLCFLLVQVRRDIGGEAVLVVVTPMTRP